MLSTKSPWLFLLLACLLAPLYAYYNPIRIDAIYVNIVSLFSIFGYGFLFGHLNEWGVLLWMLLVGFGLGAWSLRLLRLHCEGFVRFPLAVLLGWGLLGLLLIPIVWLQWLSTATLVALLALLTLPAIAALWVEGKPLLQSLRRPKLREINWLIGVPVGVALFIAFCSALMPPTQSDGLRYHLPVPDAYLRAGGFEHLPYLSFSNFPFLVEYLFLFPLALDCLSGPKLLHASYFVLTGWLIADAGRKLPIPGAGAWGVLLFASTPFVPIFASWSFIEGALAAYTLLTLLAAMQCREAWGRGEESAAWRWALVAGLAGGFMLGCKYTALASMAFACLLIAWPLNRRLERWSLGLGLSAVSGLVAFLLALPWYAKNLWLFGNPLYPFAGGLFPTPGWSAFNAAFFHYHAGLKGNLTAFQQASMGGQAIDLLTLPVRMVLYPGEPWHPEDFGGWPLGPLWLLLGLVLLLMRRWQARMVYYAVGAVFLFLVWALTYRDIRFLMPSLALAAPLLGAVAVYLVEQKRWVRWVILALVAHNLIKTFALTFLPFNYMPWMVISGQISEETYLTEWNDFTRHQCQAFAWLEDNHPDAPVVLHGIQTPFYCQNAYLGADWFDTDPLLEWSWQAEDREDVLSRLRERGIEYLVYDYGNIEQYRLFYRLFRLPPEMGLPLLQDLVAQESTRVNYPRAYEFWQENFMQRIREAEAEAANLDILDGILGEGQLVEVFRYDEDPEDPREGIRILRIPPGEE